MRLPGSFTEDIIVSEREIKTGERGKEGKCENTEGSGWGIIRQAQWESDRHQ